MSIDFLLPKHGMNTVEIVMLSLIVGILLLSLVWFKR
jgi:hypothetical protein